MAEAVAGPAPPATRKFPSLARENCIWAGLQWGRGEQGSSLVQLNSGEGAEPWSWGPVPCCAFPGTAREMRPLGLPWGRGMPCGTHYPPVIGRLPSPRLGANRPNWCSHCNAVRLSHCGLRTQDPLTFATRTACWKDGGLRSKWKKQQDHIGDSWGGFEVVSG